MDQNGGDPSVKYYRFPSFLSRGSGNPTILTTAVTRIAQLKVLGSLYGSSRVHAAIRAELERVELLALLEEEDHDPTTP